jgi:hypothetical protein
VHDGEIGLAPVLFSSDAWLQLSGYVNFHNYIFPVLIYKLPFHVFRFCMVCYECKQECWAHCEVSSKITYLCATYIIAKFIEVYKLLCSASLYSYVFSSIYHMQNILSADDFVIRIHGDYPQ